MHNGRQDVANLCLLNYHLMCFTLCKLTYRHFILVNSNVFVFSLRQGPHCILNFRCMGGGWGLGVDGQLKLASAVQSMKRDESTTFFWCTGLLYVLGLIAHLPLKRQSSLRQAGYLLDSAGNADMT